MKIVIAALDTNLVEHITPLVKEYGQLLNQWEDSEKKIEQKIEIQDQDKDIEIQSNIDEQIIEVEHKIVKPVEERANVKLSFQIEDADAYAFESIWDTLAEEQPHGLFHHLEDILIEPRLITSLYDDYQKFMHSIILDEYIEENFELDESSDLEVYKTVFKRFNHFLDYCVKFNQTLFCMRVGEV